MVWNNNFINRNSPIEISKVLYYAKYLGAGLGKLFHQLVSQSLIDIATEFLQPDKITEDDQCGYFMKMTHISATDWLIGPCNQKTNPGAFLCRTNVSRIYNASSDN